MNSEEYIVVNQKNQQYCDESQEINLSPSRLNKELNKILETEKMIKEYKEVITKM